MDKCKVCGRFILQEWAAAIVRGDQEEATRLEVLLERGYCDDPMCEAVALGNSGKES